MPSASVKGNSVDIVGSELLNKLAENNSHMSEEACKNKDLRMRIILLKYLSNETVRLLCVLICSSYSVRLYQKDFNILRSQQCNFVLPFDMMLCKSYTSSI
jgi:hypothetical protein